MFCFLFVAVTGQDTKPKVSADEVLKILAAYDNAWNKKDSAAVDSILAPSYVYFNSEGGITTRKGTLEFLASPKYNLTFAERSEIETYRSGDTVVVSSRWKGKGMYDKEVINDDQRCGLVFVKTGSAWKLLAEHCVQIVVK
jgi:ketosteroid isomerase-like protein